MSQSERDGWRLPSKALREKIRKVVGTEGTHKAGPQFPSRIYGRQDQRGDGSVRVQPSQVDQGALPLFVALCGDVIASCITVLARFYRAFAERVTFVAVAD